MSSVSPVANSNTEELRRRYIRLLRQCLTFSLWEGKDGSILELGGGPVLSLKIAAIRCLRLVRRQPYDTGMRREGKDWPALAESMMGEKRMDNLQYCVEEILRRNVPGDLIEAGVWRGGGTIFMRGILKAYGDTDRKVWVADSFEGLPEPDERKYPEDKGDKHYTFRSLAISLESVKENFKRYELLDDQVRFLKGWFKDTLPKAPFERLSLIRLDGDMYESTMDGLTHLYPKLSPGGFVIVDDFSAIPACQKAVEDYRAEHSIQESIERIDWTGAFWKKAS